MTRPLHPITSIPAPAAWASYLVNGDASGLTPEERAQADAWLAREGVRIVGTEPDAEPYFSWAARILVPELDCTGAEMLDYRAEELTITESAS